MYSHSQWAVTCTLAYDVLDRLTGQADNTSFKLWGYDANSNRTNAQFGSSNYLYAMDSASNRLQAVAGPVAKTYSYDAAGNPLSDGTATFTWNAAGKLSTTGGCIDSAFGGKRLCKAKAVSRGGNKIR